jgi:hypothetical protein
MTTVPFVPDIFSAPKVKATLTDEDMFSVSSGFIGDFKVGDNINHSLRILAVLYQVQQNASGASEAEFMHKPITIFIGSICEAILFDFHYRIRRFTFEGVKNVAESVANYVRGTRLDEFSKYTASAKKHDLLNDAGSDIYDALEELRKLRNRIHIQNTNRHFEPDDSAAFTMKRQVEAEKTLEKVIKLMATKYNRHSSKQGFVADFELPWNEHFSK